MREYDLWIDESGRFDAEEEADVNLNPSLIGGILIEKGKLQSRTITRLVNKGAVGETPHATNYDRTQMRNVVLPSLKKIRDSGGHIFYIENQERIQTLSNRDLYLRMLAGGLVQLMMTISQESEEGFILNVTVAMRSVHETEDSHEHGTLITDNEYISTLKEYIRDCWNSDKFDVELDCVLNVSIQDARKEETLQLADYACNARLTRNSKKFSDDMRATLRALTESKYLYKVYVNLAENNISSAVATGDIAEALMVYFTTRDTGLDRKKALGEIKDRVSVMSYRLNRLNLESFSDQIVAYVRVETDFERSETILKQVLKEIPFIYKEIKIPIAPSLMQIYFCLSDMYLREGDVCHAGTAIDGMRSIIGSMGNQLEDLKWLYFYNDRKALYEICSMNYEAAVSTIDKSIKSLQSILASIDLDDNIGEFFTKKENTHSEYLGNALCMKIYAELFLQKSDKSVYGQSFRKDIAMAIAQYDFDGGKERNLQYKSFAEASAGLYKDSFESLMKSACLSISGDVKKDSIALLEKAQAEDRLSRTYYLMYYLYLMTEAVDTDDSLSLQMYDALLEQKSMYDEFLKNPKNDNTKANSQHDIIKTEQIGTHIFYKDIFGDSISDSHYDYHPLEIVLWKFGSYLRTSGKGATVADDYYKKALTICRENPDYDYLKMIYIAIECDRIRGWKNKKPPEKIWSSLKNEVRELSRKTALPSGMKNYVKAAKTLVDRHYKDDNVTDEELRKMVDRVGY